MDLATRFPRFVPRAATALTVALLAVAGTAYAADPVAGDAQPLQSGPPSPPPEAFSACQSKASGDACSVTMGDRTIDGTCAQDTSGTLFCRPSHPPGPPPEAFTACQGHSSGDACTMTGHGHTMSGTCENAPGGQTLACRPSGPPPGGER